VAPQGEKQTKKRPYVRKGPYGVRVSRDAFFFDLQKVLEESGDSFTRQELVVAFRPSINFVYRLNLQQACPGVHTGSFTRLVFVWDAARRLFKPSSEHEDLAVRNKLFDAIQKSIASLRDATMTSHVHARKDMFFNADFFNKDEPLQKKWQKAARAIRARDASLKSILIRAPAPTPSLPPLRPATLPLPSPTRTVSPFPTGGGGGSGARGPVVVEKAGPISEEFPSRGSSSSLCRAHQVVACDDRWIWGAVMSPEGAVVTRVASVDDIGRASKGAAVELASHPSCGATEGAPHVIVRKLRDDDEGVSFLLSSMIAVRNPATNKTTIVLMSVHGVDGWVHWGELEPTLMKQTSWTGRKMNVEEARCLINTAPQHTGLEAGDEVRFLTRPMGRSRDTRCCLVIIRDGRLTCANAGHAGRGFSAPVDNLPGMQLLLRRGEADFLDRMFASETKSVCTSMAEDIAAVPLGRESFVLGLTQTGAAAVHSVFCNSVESKLNISFPDQVSATVRAAKYVSVRCSRKGGETTLTFIVISRRHVCAIEVPVDDGKKWIRM
jgi:hypothetical protein